MNGYLSNDGNLGYRHIPKTACTSIKSALYELEESRAFSIEEYGVNIHRYVDLNKTRCIDDCKKRFIVIRDPIKRLLSAYGNRVTYHRELSKEFILKNSLLNYHKIKFFDPDLFQFIEEFETYLNVQTISHHTKPFSEFLDGETLDYFTDVFKIEDLHSLETDLAEYFNVDFHFERKQTGGRKYSISDLSKVHIEKLLAFYKNDYELFKDYYSVDDVWKEWKKDSGNKLHGSLFTKKIDLAEPLVSVILPVFNAQAYISEAIESVLAQDYRNFELIIINDGSTDNSAKIIESYTSDTRLKYIKLHQNNGISLALNLGLEMANGEFIARMDADDIAFPNRLSKQVSFMKRHTDYVACGSSVIFFNEHNTQYKAHFPSTNEEIRAALSLFSHHISHPTIMMRAETIRLNRLRYSTSHLYAEDFHLWSKMIKLGKLYNFKEPLLYYRHHSSQVSAEYRKNQLAVSRIVLRDYLSNFFNSDYARFPQDVYINLLIHESGNDSKQLSYIEAYSAFRDLLAYSKQEILIDSNHAKKILLYQYLRASIHYRCSNFQRIKVLIYCIISNPKIMTQNLLEAMKLFKFSRGKDSESILHWVFK